MDRIEWIYYGVSIMSTVKNTRKKGEEKAGFAVNKSLNKFRKMELFKDKVDKTNHILKTVGLPKGW